MLCILFYVAFDLGKMFLSRKIGCLPPRTRTALEWRPIRRCKSVCNFRRDAPSRSGSEAPRAKPSDPGRLSEGLFTRGIPVHWSSANVRKKRSRSFFLWPFLNALGCSVGCFTVVLMVGFWSFFLFESSPCIFACGMLLGGRSFLGGNAYIAEVSFLFNVAITIFPESSHSLRKHRPLQSPNVDHENPWVLWVPAWFWHKCSSCVIVRLGSTYKITCRFRIISFTLSIPVTPLFFLGAPDFCCRWNSAGRLLRRTSLAFSASSLGRRPTSYFHAGVTKTRNGVIFGKHMLFFFFVLGNVFNNTPEHHVAKK